MKGSSTFNLNVPWGHIAAKSWGNIEETRVLMVHGTLDNAGTFDRLIPMLPQNFYYVCIDLPGHGFSSHFQNGTTLNFSSYILVIKYVLDELKWEHTYYIGHSFGAQLGFYFSLIYPGRIKKLILIDSVLPRIISNDEIISRIRFEQECVKHKRNNKYTKEQIIYALKYLRFSCLTSEAAEALFERGVTKVDENSYIYNRDYRLGSMVLPLFSLELQSYLLTHIKVETLLIIVTDTLSYQRVIYRKILNVWKNYSNVNIVKIKGNHDIHNNYPERISEHVSSFLCYTSSKL